MKGTLIVGAKRFELSGRAALIHARLGEWTQWFNDTGLGQVVIDFGHAEVKIKRTENLPTIRLDDEGMEWEG